MELNILWLFGGWFIEANNLPISFPIVRAGSIPLLVRDERSRLKAGITGSDILWENDISFETESDEIPLEKLVTGCKQPFLYVGITRIFSESIERNCLRQPCLNDLSRTMLATKYPRIANDFLNQRGITEVDIFYIAGCDEAMPYIYPNCSSILGTEDTGKTRVANNIEILEKILKVTTRLIRANDKLTRMDKDILDDFKERIAVAVERNK